MREAEFVNNFVISQKEIQSSVEREYINNKVANMEREILDKFIQKFGFDVGYKLLVEKTFHVVNESRSCQYRVSIYRCEEDGTL